jgi:hypothetical protein
MFWFFKKKRDLDALETEVKESFNHVKDDFSKVSQWIKHLDGEQAKNNDEMQDVKSDINAIKNLTGLIYLYLSHNNITNITVLKNMKSLAELGLTDVNLVDISPLADVNQIQYLWLDFNPITDINVMTKYNHLKMFSLYFNPLSFKSWCVYLKQVINNNPSATGTYSNQLLDDRFTDWKDLSVFADQWLQNCNLANGYCHGADFSEDGKVDFYDFAIFANWWMYNK